MHSTRRELLDEFVLFVGDANDADARTLAEGCLNRAMQTVWMQEPWRVFRSPVPLQLTLVAGQSRYALPDYFGRVGPGEVRNASRGGIVTRLKDGELETLFPLANTALQTTGQTRRYEIAGTCGVHTQPLVTGEDLEAVSSDASDTDIVVSLAGDDPVGRWTRAQVTLNGTTPVGLGVWTFIDEAGKSFQVGSDPVTPITTSRGTVTIRKVGTEEEVQRLFAQESAKSHDIFTVYPSPAAADVLLLPLIRKPKRLFEDSDTLPDLWGPALWEEMLIEWQVNLGELNPITAMQAPRPKLLKLVALENQQRDRPIKRPFGMGQ